jgi:excisionase family DNA binding protein
MPELLTIKELSERLKISTDWIYRQRKKKKNPIPFVVLGKRNYRYPVDKVYSWLDAGYAKN